MRGAPLHTDPSSTNNYAGISGCCSSRRGHGPYRAAAGRTTFKETCSRPSGDILDSGNTGKSLKERSIAATLLGYEIVKEREKFTVGFLPAALSEVQFCKKTKKQEEIFNDAFTTLCACHLHFPTHLSYDTICEFLLQNLVALLRFLLRAKSFGQWLKCSASQIYGFSFCDGEQHCIQKLQQTDPIFINSTVCGDGFFLSLNILIHNKKNNFLHV